MRYQNPSKLFNEKTEQKYYHDFFDKKSYREAGDNRERL